MLAGDFDKPAMLRRFELPATKFIVLAVGQFIDRKGRWTFLEAAAIVLKSRSDIHFVWLTPVLPNEADQERIARMGVGGDFTLILSENVGREHKQILEFFRIADVFALPSFVEGLPIALLEAMALGIPSISTNINGIPEAIIDGETGILIEPGDSEALAKSIIGLADDVSQRQRLSKNGRHFVIEHFDERVAARTALTAYKESLRND